MTKITGASANKFRPRLFVYSLGLIFQRRVRKILSAHGWSLKLGLPLSKTDGVAVWGRKGPAKRGMRVAQIFQKPLLTVEDAFLRSVLTGRQGAQSLGIIADWAGVYFDTDKPNDLGGILIESQNISQEEQQLATKKMAYLRHIKLSKYNNFTLNVPELADDYILVVDQTLNDAAILKGGADANSFVSMLACAKAENPDKKIYIKTHPETDAGKRKGYFSNQDCDEQVSLITSRTSPYTLFEKATKIYCVTSQVGLEAVFAGHRPIIFGRPFYAGLGLTDDRGPTLDRKLTLTAAQLFWSTHLQYSKWYDPYFDRKTDFLTVARILNSRARQHQDNQLPAQCIGMRLWKRGFLKTYLSGHKHTPRFHQNADQAIKIASQTGSRVMVWAGLETDAINHACTQQSVPLIRIEDGFLRSVGLGAQLIAPVSLAFDDVGIYYDPTRPSRLEHIINAASDLSDLDLERAKSIQDRIVVLKMTKYNLPKSATVLNAGKNQQVILVPGQVEDDASIQKGAGQIKTNLQLLNATRKDFPDAYIVTRIMDKPRAYCLF